MQKMSDAVKLADSLISTAKSFDKKVIAYITDMNQPLGNYIGNWLEVYESVKVLRGEINNDLLQLSLTLAGTMIYLGGNALTIDEGIKLASELISNGKALDKFLEIVKLQGGDTDYIENLEKYPKSKFIKKIKLKGEGHLEYINNYEIGMASVILGAGREKIDDMIDPKAGIIFYPKIGNKINKGDVIAELHSSSKEKIKEAERKVYNSLRFSENKVKRLRLVKRIIE